ncbi:MAG: HDIG domain-containing protein [Solirubrobacteraceae bacterium]|nr:HDIG domain-containing protein [Solirubrobacteraceae bacterium]
MPTPIDRATAWELLTEWVQSESLRKHCLAVEASMRAVARERGEDEELYGVTGLLHDLDYEQFPDLETGHPRKVIALLEERDADPAVIHAITAHAPYLGVAPETDLARALLAVDELSGFVMAVAYVRPEGIHGMTPKSVKKKLKTPAFAAAVSRDDVAQGPELLGVELDDLIRLVIGALEADADALALNGKAAAAE